MFDSMLAALQHPRDVWDLIGPTGMVIGIMTVTLRSIARFRVNQRTRRDRRSILADLSAE